MSDLEQILRREAEIAESEPEEEEYPFTHPRPAREPSQVYSIRIPVRHLEELRELASSRHVTVSALLREWILERLRLERRLALPPNLEIIRDQIVHDVIEAIPVTVARSVRSASEPAVMDLLEALRASVEAARAMQRETPPDEPAQASA